MSETEETYDHAECMCVDGDTCRYHQALNRAETLAAENARLRLMLTVAWEDLGQYGSHDPRCGLIVASLRRVPPGCTCGFQNAQDRIAPAPAERGPFGVIRSDDSQGLPQ